MQPVTAVQTVSLNITDETSIQSSSQMNKATKVYVRLMFLRIGEIDTLNEKYQAQAAVEARWIVDVDKLSSELSLEDQKRMEDGKSISLQNYAETHWHPQLYIENAIGDLKEQIRYTAKRAKEDDQIYVCEHRDIKGSFWEKLELQHFPSDVQDLSISVASMLFDDKVLLFPDPYQLSGVNREAFVDQQEWLLYEHVDTEQRYVKEFLFQGYMEDDDDDDNDDDHLGEDANNNEDRKRPIITVTCHAARRSKYFYWNGYGLILLITVVSFCIFAIPPNLAASRIQITCTLLLTSITFRWTVNRSLPTISYLTSMDVYAIICIFALVIQSIWHAIIGSIIFMNTPDNRLTSSMWYAHLDRYIFLATIFLFIVVHIVLITWTYLVPFKHRKNMAKKDVDYHLLMSSKKTGQNGKGFGRNSKKFTSFSRIPIGTEV